MMGLALALLLSLAPLRIAWADTDYLREFAKNKTRLLIVASGPEARPLAETLEKTIEQNGDFRGKDPNGIRVVTPAEAEPLLKGDFARASVVQFLTAKDGVSLETLSEDLKRRLPFDPTVIGTKLSIVQSNQDSDRPGEPVYRVALYAPDTERLSKLYARFTGHKAGNYRDLPFSAKYITNRVAVFSSAKNKPMLSAPKNWGGYTATDAQVWNDINVYDFSERAKLTPEQLAECSEVYFVNRAEDTDLPDPARIALENQTIRRPTVLITRRLGEKDANPVYVVSSPSRGLLQSRILRYPDIRTLEENAPKSEEVIDIAGVTEASLLIVGGKPTFSPELADSLHVELSRKLRSEYGINVEPRGAVLTALEGELALQMARGVTDTKGLLRRRFPTRYAWVFSITQASGETTFEPNEKKITPNMRAFNEDEPEEPHRRNNESSDDFDIRWRKWRDRWRQWDRNRRNYEDRYRTAACEWEVSLTAKRRAEVRGILQLIDQQAPNGAAFLWEKRLDFTADENEVVRMQRVTVRGHDNHPDSLETPAATETCPSDLMLTASLGAAKNALASLSDEAILPGEATPQPPVTTVATTPPAPTTGKTTAEKLAVKPSAKPPVPATPAKKNEGRVAEVDKDTLILNLGEADKVKVGDRFEILLVYKETTDPDTGKVIRLRVQESFFVVVTAVDTESCDVRPATPGDAAKLVKVKVGAKVRRAP